MQSPDDQEAPQVVAWEMTRRCPYRCRHCRAAAGTDLVVDELDTQAGAAFVEDLAALGCGLLILTGGEPMLRPDFLILAQRAAALGLRVVAAVCGSLIDAASVAAMRQAGVRAVSLSLDGCDDCSHDAFRGRTGAHADLVAATAHLRAGGLPFQINTTVHRGNHAALPAIRDQVRALGASVWDLFLLVPTGRGQALAAEALAGPAYEEVLQWAIHQTANGDGPALRVTCAPRHAPLAAAQGARGRGCLGGRSFAFVSSTGVVQACGFLPVPAGSLREQRFSAIWRTSPLFADLRAPERLRGACGSCGHRTLCGGCRARALAGRGDLLHEDPCCPLAIPRAGSGGHG